MIKHAILISGLIVSFLASAAEMSFLAQLTEVPGASGYEKMFVIWYKNSGNPTWRS